jgi:hypothetical protein
MTYTAGVVSTVDPVSLELPTLSRRERNTNVGYVLFAFGVLWVIAIAVAMLGSPISILDCQLTALGDVIVCEPQSVASEPSTAGLNIANMAIPRNLAGAAYDAH